MSSIHQHMQRGYRHGREVEDALIGALLLWPARFGEASHLAPADLVHEGYRRVFAAAKALYARGVPPDAIMICDELRRTGQYSAEHGASAGHLAECYRLAPSGYMLPHYIAAIKPRPATIDNENKLARARRRSR